MSFLEGFGIGLATIIFIGLVFFLLLNSSLLNGTKAGIAVAFGIIISDIVCVLLCYFGLSSFLSATVNQFWLGLLGAVILLGLGITYLAKNVIPIENSTDKSALNSSGLLHLFIKGFSVNFFNPFVFVVWIGIFQYGKSSYPNKLELLSFIIAVLLGILTIDLLKVVVAKSFRKRLDASRWSFQRRFGRCEHG